MSLYLKYFFTIVRHKWYVLMCVRRTGITYLPRLILHDMSKFLPSEFIPYARYWGKEPEERTAQEVSAFEEAKKLHYSRNKHHWQYWFKDFGEGVRHPYLVPMDYDSLFELICDWRAAGLAYNGVDDSKEYYVREGPRMSLHHETREDLELYLDTSWRPVKGDFKFKSLYELRKSSQDKPRR